MEPHAPSAVSFLPSSKSRLPKEGGLAFLDGVAMMDSVRHEIAPVCAPVVAAPTPASRLTPVRSILEAKVSFGQNWVGSVGQPCQQAPERSCSLCKLPLALCKSRGARATMCDSPLVGIHPGHTAFQAHCAARVLPMPLWTALLIGWVANA